MWNILKLKNKYLKQSHVLLSLLLKHSIEVNISEILETFLWKLNLITKIVRTCNLLSFLHDKTKNVPLDVLDLLINFLPVRNPLRYNNKIVQHKQNFLQLRYDSLNIFFIYAISFRTSSYRLCGTAKKRWKQGPFLLFRWLKYSTEVNISELNSEWKVFARIKFGN